jgi:TolB-like protein/Flp pilus assembly protein TadD
MAEFFAEVKRRHIFRVAAAYAVIAWLLLQLVNNVAPVLDLPIWVARALLLLLAIGFPVALIFAWTLDLKVADRSQARPAATKMDVVLAAAVIALIAILAYQQLGPGPVALAGNSDALSTLIVAAALALAGTGTTVFLVRRSRTKPEAPAIASTASSPPSLRAPDKPSIAVLPFTNMCGDSEQEYFVDGVVEDIISGLSRLKWLFVIARNSSFTYKGKPVDVKQAGRELGVRYVLEGSVRKAAGRVRITGQLVEAETGRHIWAEHYDRDFTDIFALQDELTISVVAAIEPNLRQAEIERVMRKRAESLDAYDLVLRALPHVYPAMPEEAAKALPLLENALAIEPNYALAHGFAAWAHEILFLRGGAREQNRLGAVRHAQAAIAHGRDDAIALTLGGFAIGMVAHDREAAREAFEAALALSPSTALTYLLGGVVMGYGGDADRAIEWGERAHRLSPFDPIAYCAYMAMALGHFQPGHYEEATSAARKMVQSNPNFSISHMVLAATLAKVGRLDEAKAAASRVKELQPGFTIRGMCAVTPIDASLAASLSEALRAAGLPE